MARPDRNRTHRAARLARASRSILGVALLAGLAGAASTATADEGEGLGLAPPGPCAEPREALAGSGMTESDFSISGALSALFVPADVAAAPARPVLQIPSARALIRPGACDVPGAGCAPALPTGTRAGLPNPPVVGGPAVRPSPR